MRWESSLRNSLYVDFFNIWIEKPHLYKDSRRLKQIWKRDQEISDWITVSLRKAADMYSKRAERYRQRLDEFMKKERR